MSQGNLQQLIKQYRAQLLAHEAQAERQLEAAYAHVLSTIHPQLERIYQQIADKQSSGEAVPLSWLYEERRIQTLTQFIEHEINLYGALARVQTGQLQQQGVTLGQEAAMRAL